MKDEADHSVERDEARDLPRRGATLPNGFEELRELLLGRERFQLSRLQRRVENPVLRAEDVGQVLPQAFLRCAQGDDRLAHAMSPTVEAALRASIKRDPTPLANAIYPVIGSAIRKALADMLSRLVHSFNHALEHSLSPRGVGWRLEA